MSKITGNNFSSIQQMSDQLLKSQSSSTAKRDKTALTFEQILRSQALGETGGLKFSKHANERLSSRNIDLSTTQLERLENGARRAGEKGITESLVMVDDLAFIVNIKNNTVITAVGKGDDRVFSNIDGAVII